ncbi:hypothetical protein [Methylocystis heyeri]|uniref:Uncharacterized protein n=1 Tax=Methylocystis heyeri TaxID=391905 RepID=A0A6B8KIJ7_9HYPH|nr:hypothetical protein [Methylocystis heyeri]QGM47309.1 hypothetical protein H2LOC_017330 [Methylocystis heyeri]
MAHAKPALLRRLAVVVTIGAGAYAMSSPRTGAEPRPSVQEMCEAASPGENASCQPR